MQKDNGRLLTPPTPSPPNQQISQSIKEVAELLGCTAPQYCWVVWFLYQMFHTGGELVSRRVNDAQPAHPVW